MMFEGTGTEADDEIGENVERVKRQIRTLIDFGVERRRNNIRDVPELLPVAR